MFLADFYFFSNERLTMTGGSLRIPAACTGIFSLRPSFGRFPVRDCRSGMAGQEAVNAVNGPLARTIHDIELYSKTVVDAKPWLQDAKCLPIPWRATELPSKLKIAVMWHDDMVLPTPPVARALRETADKLKSAGHDVVEWDPVDQKAGLQLIGRMFVADGGKSIRQEFEKSGEPLRPEMAQFQSAKELGTYEMWQLQSERSAFQNKYLERWVKSGIDAILCPVMPFNNVENGNFQHSKLNGGGVTFFGKTS
jgi:amidase